MNSTDQLRLPGSGHSLWIPRAIATAVSLPGEGFALWGASPPSIPIHLRSNYVALPGNGESVWIQSYPQREALLASLEAGGSGKGLSLPGEGFHLWSPDVLQPLEVRLVGTPSAAASGLTLPGEGFSIWIDPQRSRIQPAAKGVCLPGASFSLWTTPHVQKSSGQETENVSERPLYPESSHQPPLKASTMKLFGFVQWVGVFLILALLFGFLGTRQQADELDRKLAATDEELVATKQERQTFLDRANALQIQLDEASAREAQLNRDVDSLEKAKEGIENTMKTQVANLEKANQAVEAAKAKLDQELAKTTGDLKNVSGQLEEVTAAKKAQEAALTASINEAKAELGQRQAEVAELKQSLTELSGTKSDLEKRLQESSQALSAAKEEAQELRSMLDQSEKSKSEMQKQIETLEAELEAKEKAAQEAEEAAAEAGAEANAAVLEQKRLLTALEASQRQIAKFKSNEFVPEDGVVEVIPAEREEELLRQLTKERQEREAIAAFLVQLQGQVKQLKGELASARTADL